jgi:hypothetical protein
MGTVCFTVDWLLAMDMGGLVAAMFGIGYDG